MHVTYNLGLALGELTLAYHKINKQILTLWLIVMVVLLSVGSSIHSISHINDSTTHHSAYCSSLHQLQSAVTSHSFVVLIQVQSYVCSPPKLIGLSPLFAIFSRCRAPPINAR